MSITRVSTYYLSESTLDNLIDAIKYQEIGHFQLDLTEMETTSKPSITENSIIEVNGKLYEFQSDETISGTPSTGYCYAKCYLSGSDLLCDMTNTAPTWDNDRRGYYGSSGTANHRYIAKMYYDSGNYTQKMILDKEIL